MVFLRRVYDVRLPGYGEALSVMRFSTIPLLVALIGCRSNHVQQSNAPTSPHQSEIVDSGEEAGIVDAGIDIAAAPTTTLLIGDSQVLYAGYYFGKSNVKHDNETVLFDSKPGTTILTWNNIFVREMNKFPHVDTVVIFLSTNNHNFNFVQPHDNILNEIKHRQVRCIWVGGTNVYGKRWPIYAMVKAAVEPTCTYFDTENAGIELADGVHPSKDGMIKWLTLIWQVKDAMP